MSNSTKYPQCYYPHINEKKFNTSHPQCFYLCIGKPQKLKYGSQLFYNNNIENK